MKKFLALALALMMVFALAACGDKGNTKPNNSTDPGTSQQQPSNTPDESTPPASQGGASVSDTIGWPDNEFTKLVPKPDCSFSKEGIGDSKTFYTYPNWTQDEAKAYVATLESSGFTISGSPAADNEETYMVYLKNADETYKVTVLWELGSDGTLAISKIS